MAGMTSTCFQLLISQPSWRPYTYWRWMIDLDDLVYSGTSLQERAEPGVAALEQTRCKPRSIST